MRSKLGIALTFLVMMTCSSLAETIHDFRKPDYGPRLFNNIITALVKDDHGFLWLATRSELVRFDGNGFMYPAGEINRILFKDDNVVQRLYFRKPDLLYVCTNLGLYKVSLRSHTISSIHGFEGLRVNSILFAGNGKMLVNSVEGIAFYDPETGESKKMVLFSVNRSTGQYPLGTSMAADSHGRLWVMANFLLLRITLPEWMKGTLTGEIHADTLMSFRTPHQLLVDKFDRLWYWDRQALKSAIITDGGTLGKVISETVEVTALGSQGNNIIFSNRGRGNIMIMRDKDGNITGRKEILLSDQFDDLSNTTNAFYSESNGQIWLGTRDGLFSLNQDDMNPFRNLKSNPNVANNIKHSTVSCVLAGKNDDIWVATANGFNRIRFLDKNKEKYEIENFIDSRPEKNPLDGNKIQSMIFDQKGLLWLGTKDNLKFFDPVARKFSDRPAIVSKLLNTTFVRALYQDSRNNIWIGFDSGGVFCYNPSADSLYSINILADRHRLNECMSINEGPGNEIWVGSRESGLFRIIPGNDQKSYTCRQYRFSDSDSTLSHLSDFITTIFTDPYSNLWVGTAEGLFLYNFEKDVFKRTVISFENDNQQYISGIINDNRGNLWISTLSGICKYRVTGNQSVFFPLYKRNLTRMSFQFSSVRDKDGFIFLTGINGLTYFNPDQVRPDTTTNQLFFTDFRVHNRTIATGSKILPQEINYLDKIVLDYSDNQFSFSFSALSYEKNENIGYAYMLDGIDKDWINAGKGIRNISYSNLPWGTYDLRLRSTDTSGKWQPDVRSLRILVRPPLWAKWYSFVFYFALIVLMVWSVIRISRMRTELKTRSLINSLRLKFFTNITYSIKTPLMLLQTPLQSLVDNLEEFSFGQIRSMLQIMSTNSKRLSLLIDQLTEIRRIDQGKVALNIGREDIVEFVSKICQSFENTFASNGIELIFNTNVPSRMLYFDRIKLEVVLFNLLSNAYKFSFSGSKVEISCDYVHSDKLFWITIKDHGYGIDAGHLKHVFDQFWSNDVSETGKLSGAGIGLSLVKEYVELHCGEIFVESRQGEGSVFKFCLKRGKEHFKNRTGIVVEDAAAEKTVIRDYIGSISSQATSSAEKPPAKQVIIVIEGNENLRNEINNILGDNYQIINYNECENVFNIISTVNPLLIIANSTFGNEPEGISLCRIVKSNPLTGHIPFVLITTSDNHDERQEAYQCGADAFLTLPSEMEQLPTRSFNLINLSETIRRRLRQEIIVSPKEEVLKSTDDKFLAKAMEVVEQNIAFEDFSVKYFSEKMNVCSSMLYRKIKSLTGLSPNDLVKDIRLTKAAQLLGTRAFNVSEVGMKVGFKDTRYFSVCFKKRYGVSPSGFATVKQ